MISKEEILIKHAPVFQFDFDDELKNRCTEAMQEYLDQGLSEYKAKLKERFDDLYENNESITGYHFKLFKDLIDTTEI